MPRRTMGRLPLLAAVLAALLRCAAAAKKETVRVFSQPIVAEDQITANVLSQETLDVYIAHRQAYTQQLEDLKAQQLAMVEIQTYTTGPPPGWVLSPTEGWVRDDQFRRSTAGQQGVQGQQQQGVPSSPGSSPGGSSGNSSGGVIMVPISEVLGNRTLEDGPVSVEDLVAMPNKPGSRAAPQGPGDRVTSEWLLNFPSGSLTPG